jgi:hypothetical protein
MRRKRVNKNPIGARSEWQPRKWAKIDRILKASRDWERLQQGAARLGEASSQTLPARKSHSLHRRPVRKNLSPSHYAFSVSIVTLRLV